MPSNSIQSRIAAFENGTIKNSDPDSDEDISSEGIIKPSEPANSSVPTVNVLNVLDSPISPSASIFAYIKSNDSGNSRSSSPEILGRKSELISLSELSSAASGKTLSLELPRRPLGPTHSRSDISSTGSTSSTHSGLATSFIGLGNLQTQAPSLPLRKPISPASSSPSSSSSYPRSSNMPGESFSNSASVSRASVTPLDSGSTGLSNLLDVNSGGWRSDRMKMGHKQGLSASSFQSISLSDGELPEAGAPEDHSLITPSGLSVADAISAFNSRGGRPEVPTKPILTPNKILSPPALAIPEHQLPYAPRIPPRLRLSPSDASLQNYSVPPKTPPVLPRPQSVTAEGRSTSAAPPLPPRTTSIAPASPMRSRPLNGFDANLPSPSFSQTSLPPLSIRRVAPPAIPFDSPPSSSASRMAEKRKAPVPLSARRRYEILFRKNIPSNESDADRLTDISNDRSQANERIAGQTVKAIWLCSKLSRSVLRQIWSDCDTEKSGSLDIEAFVRGMWAIDTELAKNARFASRKR